LVFTAVFFFDFGPGFFVATAPSPRRRSNLVALSRRCNSKSI
jgi:hypothetical protein